MISAFAFGFVGGLAVNIIRLYTISQSPKEDRPLFDAVYFAQFSLLAVLGGVVAVAHSLDQPIKPLIAFNVGVSVPALIKAGTITKSRVGTIKSD